MRWLWVLGLVACGQDEVAVDGGWGPEAAGQGWGGLPAEVLPPPIAPLTAASEAVAGAPLRLEVTGLQPGAPAQLLIGLSGVGAGPCHPSVPALCTDLLSPILGPSTTADAQGTARFALMIPASASGAVDFQVVVPDPAAPGVTNVHTDEVTTFDIVWNYDTLGVQVDFGESGYDFGMAETLAGPLGWYGEDCWLGQYGINVCHSVVGGRVLQSVHPDVGGPGLAFVTADQSTLFYDVHDVAITYVFFGWDSGECWAFGDDPSFYAPLGCTPIP